MFDLDLIAMTLASTVIPIAVTLGHEPTACKITNHGSHASITFACVQCKVSWVGFGRIDGEIGLPPISKCNRAGF